MRISKKWLQNFVHIPPELSPDQLADLITTRVVEVDETVSLGRDDIIFDIDNKSLSSRPDLWGHYGMARELAALFKTKLKAQKMPKIKAGNKIKLRVAVQDKKGCPRYTGVILDGITVGPSPEWLQHRLRSVGQRPINNIVDITNYVMFELGQPTHAFDASRLTPSSPPPTRGRMGGGISIIVRRAKDGEKFVTLDGVERALTSDMLVIADAEKPLALAGVMGGLHTGVSDTTKSVLFESANFDAVTVRKMSQKLGLRTEGSARWEKWQDPANAEIGLQRLVELTQKICPTARVVSNVADTGPVKLPQGPLTLPMSFVQKKIGVSINKKQVVSMLGSLGFGVKTKGNTLSVKIPSWRATKDISIPEDLVEEIARLYGYENIPATMPSFSIVPGKANPLRELERRLKELLAYEFNYTETINYSFESPAWLARLGESAATHLELNNPIAKDRPLIREQLIPNLLMNMEANLHRFDRVALFEIGRVFWGKEQGEFADNKKKERLPKQPTLLGLVYAAKDDEAPFFAVSEAIRGLLIRLGVDGRIEKSARAARLMHPGRSAEIKIGDTPVGFIGELHPAAQTRAGIPYRVGMVEIALESLLAVKRDNSRYQPLPMYPLVERDLAFVVKREAEHAALAEAIRSADPLIESVTLFDVYEGKGMVASKKSLAYHINYRSDEKTLTAEAVDQIQAKVGERLAKEFGAEIRV